MSREGIEAGKGHITVGLNDQTKKQMKAIGKRLGDWSKKTAVAAAAIGAPLLAAAKQFAATGDQIGKMAKRTNLTTKEVQSFGFAMEQSGASVDALEPGIKGMNRNLLDMSRDLTTAKDNFVDLGLNFDEFMKLGTGDRFKAILNALGDIEDEGMRAALAQKFLGRSGPALLPLIGSIDQLQKEFDELGTAMSDEQIQAAEDMTDAFNRVKHQFRAIVINVGAALAPALTDIADKIGPIIKRAIEWVKNNQSLIVGAGKLAVALAGVSVALKGVSVAMSTNPIALVAVAAIDAARRLGVMNDELATTSDKINALSPFTVGGGLGSALVKSGKFKEAIAGSKPTGLGGVGTSIVQLQKGLARLGDLTSRRMSQVKKQRQDAFDGSLRAGFSSFRQSLNQASEVMRNAGGFVGGHMQKMFGGTTDTFDPRTTTIGGFGSAFGATSGPMRGPQQTQEEILAVNMRQEDLLNNIARATEFFKGGE